jgi:hypothetical protein
MNSASIVRVITLLALGCVAGFAEPPAATETLDRYLHRNVSSCRDTDQRMDVEIEASLPQLKKHGSMKGLKVISRSGQVAYRFLRFTGDKLVKTDVIARFLTAEAQPQERLGDMGATLENYKFHFLKSADYHGATAHVFQMRPRKKRIGLYKGELWLDATSAAPLREAGELVKSPSIFIRQIRFVREYPEHDPQRAFCGQVERMSIIAQTRVAGDAELVVLQRPASDTTPETSDTGNSDGGTAGIAN